MGQQIYFYIRQVAALVSVEQSVIFICHYCFPKIKSILKPMKRGVLQEIAENFVNETQDK